MGEKEKNMHVSHCVLEFAFYFSFCVIFSSKHVVFQVNLGRLKKGLARGGRLEAFNIHRLLHVCILSELHRGKRKGNFNSSESLFFVLPRETALGGPQVFH